MADKRDRSVTLDSLKVRQLAAGRGMKTLSAFERGFLLHISAVPGVNTTVPYNAWNGKKIDKNKATGLATFLGLGSYEALLPTPCPDLVYPEPLVWDAQYSPPGALLKAEYGIVPFHQRTKEREDLDAWCFAEDKLSVRLYTGAGGMGKTRLAIEQCKRLADEQGWVAGFLKPKQMIQHEPEPFGWLDTVTAPVFVVIDYAETRREELTDFLRSAMRAKNKVRVVLLARAAADWWNLLKTAGNGVGDLLMSRATAWITLQPLALTTHDREESFFLAADSFARHLQHEPQLTPPPDLGADYFGRVLLLHMQALITLENQHINEGIQGILNVILNRERRFWESQANERHLPKAIHHAIGDAMARITFMGGVKNKQDANKVLDNIPLLAETKHHERQVIIDLLHDIYPGQHTIDADTDLCNYIEPLQPDLLGEHLIQEELKDDPDTLLNFLFAG